jgi:hypothetical protein
MSPKEKISELRRERLLLTGRIVELTNRLFPLGKRVIFKKWGKIVNAVIIEHDEYSEKIKVRSDTGKVYWLDTYYLAGI